MVSKRSILNLLKSTDLDGFYNLTSKEVYEAQGVASGVLAVAPDREALDSVFLEASVLSDYSVLKVFTTLQAFKILKVYSDDKEIEQVTINPLDALRRLTSSSERTYNFKASDLKSVDDLIKVVDRTEDDIGRVSLISTGEATSADEYIAGLLTETAPLVTRALWYTDLSNLSAAFGAFTHNKEMILSGADFSPRHIRSGIEVGPHWRTHRSPRLL